MPNKILIVEDHPDIVEIVKFNLEKEGFLVTVARDGEEGLRKVETEKPDLILLDLMLPKLGGLDVCKELRSQAPTKNIPIIMLTAKGEESDIVRGLDLGADDYMTKPFGPKELVARIRSILRRSSETPNLIQVKELLIDSDRYVVQLRKMDINLTRTEFRLLKAMAGQQGRVFTRDQLIDKVTDGNTVIVDRNIDVHISSLRKKLLDYGDFIVTVRGVGYRFVE